MITEDGFVALRVAATLAHSLPGVRIRLRHEGEILVDVAADGTPRFPGARLAVTPCGFRHAVVRAWEQAQAGGQLALLDLPAHTDPAIDLGLPPCGHTFPGGIHRVATGGRDVYAFATTSTLAAAQDEIERHAAEIAPPLGVRGIGLRRDEGTDICLVYAEVDHERRVLAEPGVVGLLEELVARVTVRALLDDLATSTSR